jgi:hypothetical protein
MPNVGLFMVFLIITFNSSLITAASEAKWVGVDESVVEKIAEEHGRVAKDPFINTDQGDLLLFMFLLGGLIGGFAAGYYWRMLTENKPVSAGNRQKPEDKVQENKIVSM